MSSINHHTREINVKMVYYGPGLGGKTTSLQFIHRTLPDTNRGEMVSLATSVDRTLFFDFLPVKLTEIRGFTIRMSLYTVPGQVHYNATRRLVLQGADGVVFVADSQPARRIANIENLDRQCQGLAGQWMIAINGKLAVFNFSHVKSFALTLFILHLHFCTNATLFSRHIFNIVGKCHVRVGITKSFFRWNDTAYFVSRNPALQCFIHSAK